MGDAIEIGAQCAASPGQWTPAAIARMLEASACFASLGTARLERVAGQSPIETFGAGTVLFAQGDPGHFAYLVLEGEVAIEVETETGRVTVAVIGSGGLVGEIAAFASVPRTATVSCLCDVCLLRIEQATIRELLAGRPEAAMAIIAELGVRLQSLNGSIATLTQATKALAAGQFEPDMLATLRQQADRFSHFADVFEDMAHEITNKRLFAQEMQTAAEIQQSFLPPGIDAGRHADRFAIAALMTPARHVGGDFFDYFMIDDDHIGFAVGDVSGKGVPAAMFMSVARTVLKTLARQGGEAGEIVGRVNALLAEDNAEGMFVTLAFARLNLVTGAMDLASGGHEEIYLVPPAGAVEKCAPMGPAVGLFAGPAFGTRHVRLVPGTRVVLATDGITEAFSADRAVFGNDRLERLLAEHVHLAPADLVKAVEANVARFAAGCPQSDDLTCLVLDYRG
ncbi:MULTISPECIES: SpoIIE family protein phosphatase [unclassified Roseitalea]|uniref:PP2C family protein-serine/threonine phosphatase n=1 Tax=unclassified Roseitalea TaxID=2639107 RepID=UPI00273EDD19|nr:MULTISPECIES: SpoIIE family protein phosphatase [unclassified Roseitalea]